MEVMGKAETIYTMNAGDGLYSYAKNSSLQNQAAISLNEKINGVITEKLDMKSLCSSSKTLRIVDLGSSTGPNTFVAMQNIVESLERAYQLEFSFTSQLPEFQVFFNDQASNDFNTLFAALPTERKYFVAGVPGTFHGRLFPKGSLHFAYSSIALQWLSKVPEELLNKNSPSWNKGRIHYTNAQDSVVNAYASQFTKDMELFLDARAKELVSQGMMVMIIPGSPSGIPHSQTELGLLIELLDSSFLDMVKEGLISQAQVDSFNWPIYMASPDEITELVKRNGCFDIEKMELTSRRISNKTPNLGHIMSMHMRAGLEQMIGKHFGNEIVDDLFGRYANKIEDLFFSLQSSKRETIVILVVLKRK